MIRNINQNDIKSCKKDLASDLKKYGFIDDRYRGKIILEIEGGGIREIEQRIRTK